MLTPLEILQKYWKYPDFRENQEVIIQAVLAGKDTLALLPTGGGKSITFQVAGLAKDGLCIVVSPLISLMDDQVERLTSLGIKAITFSGKLSFDEQLRILDNAIYGAYKFLYISPERLQSELFNKKLVEMNVNLLAVDEAHCISEWGHDFRPSYRKIALLREKLPQVPVLALTATATPEVVLDICTQLQFKDKTVIKQSFSRANLTYTVAKINDKITALERLFNKDKSPSIIYVRSRFLCNEIQEQLNYLGFKTSIYNAGLLPENRKQNFADWKNGKTQIMIATNAFGMGIDKADVRWVIHYNIPESLESYFQEAGRAGRDGELADALLLYNDADISLVKNQFLTTIPNIDFIKKCYKNLCNHYHIAYAENQEQAQDFDFDEFCVKYDFKKNKALNTLQLLHREGIIGLSENFGNKSSFKFLISNDELLLYIERSKVFEPLLHYLLRTTTGAFELFANVNEYEIARNLSISKNAVIEQLKLLEEANILIYNNTNTAFSISFLHIREDDRTINRIKKNILALHKQKEQKVKAMLDYVVQKKQCSAQYLLQYFGEKSDLVCGKCNNCKRQQKLTNQVLENIADSILNALHNEALSSQELLTQLDFDKTTILEALRILLAQNKIRVDKYNRYFLA